MLRLGLPERALRLDRGDDLRRPQTGRVHVLDRVACDLLLLRADREDRRAVARAGVVALTGECRGVVDLEAGRQDVPVGRGRGVEGDLDGLRVTWVVAVGRVVVLPAGVSHAGSEYAGLATEEILHAPEAPPGKDRRLGALLEGDLAGGVGVARHAGFSSSELWSMSANRVRYSP